jgi:hypothetical protein
MKVDIHPENWYFSTYGFLGLGAERTLATYKPDKNELSLTQHGFRHIVKILSFLKKHWGIHEIKVVWHNED